MVRIFDGWKRGPNTKRVCVLLIICILIEQRTGTTQDPVLDLHEIASRIQEWASEVRMLSTQVHTLLERNLHQLANPNRNQRVFVGKPEKTDNVSRGSVLRVDTVLELIDQVIKVETSWNRVEDSSATKFLRERFFSHVGSGVE